MLYLGHFIIVAMYQSFCVPNSPVAWWEEKVLISKELLLQLLRLKTALAGPCTQHLSIWA